MDFETFEQEVRAMLDSCDSGTIVDALREVGDQPICNENALQVLHQAVFNAVVIIQKLEAEVAGLRALADLK